MFFSQSNTPIYVQIDVGLASGSVEGQFFVLAVVAHLELEILAEFSLLYAFSHSKDSSSVLSD